ncbi:MAG: LON peptidase substrate-binding domain-containing protein [Alphaproteobacteria bacterium]|nr:LON peptidase substrate-binding domain-containing protein [Alphaproteobacteria bacterium]
MPRAYRKPSDLPAVISVFPLGGAILFPRAVLPLNIFEPRYLNMIDDALAGDRLIGMIQPAGLLPAPLQTDGDNPELAEVGCVGRLTSFQETDDGRYLVGLSGVTRFRIIEETTRQTPYRTVRADWTAFADDLLPDEESTVHDRTELVTALNDYLERNGLNADWSAIKDAPVDMLINSLSTGCPFTNPEKQALLEARTLHDRCSALIALLVMERPGQGGGYVQ